MSANGVVTIGIDARELLGEATGVGRYLGELLRRWVQRPDAPTRHLVLYTPEPLPFLQTVPSTAHVREIVAGSGRGTWWEQTHLRRAVHADPPDVFFAGAYTAPLALRVPLAVTIHDVSFAAHPEWFRPREGARRRLLTRQAAASPPAVGRSEATSQPVASVRLSVRAAQRDVHKPAISQSGQRRRPGQASSMQKKKATRMKPPTILVAIGAPPRSIGAPTGNRLRPARRGRYPPG